MSAKALPACPACGGTLYLDQRGLRGLHRDSCWIDDQELRVQHADSFDERVDFIRVATPAERAIVKSLGASDGDVARLRVRVRRLASGLRTREFRGVPYVAALWRPVLYGHPALEGSHPLGG